MKTTTTRSKMVLLLLLLLLLLLSCANGEYDRIGDYQPVSDVTSLLKMADDLRLIDNLLTTESDDGFAKALKVYQLGAYSNPSASLAVSGGIPYDIPDGAKLIGLDRDGMASNVTATFGPYKAGDTKLRIVFPSGGGGGGNGGANGGAGPKIKSCLYAGIPEPQTNGCLVLTGDLVLDGQTKPFTYVYADSDITVDHTLQGFSTNAKSKYRPNGAQNMDYFRDFQKYVDFFGTPDFADQMITAAFNEGQYTTAAVGSGSAFQLDFGIFNPRARRSFIVHAIAYFIVTPFVIRSLETALVKCDRNCQLTTCNLDAISNVDDAVALYTGSLFLQNKKGNFMFGLADNMCQQFRTCGKYGNSTLGRSKVNWDIFQHFIDTKNYLNASQCLQAKIVQGAVSQKIFIPLIQGALLSMFIDAQQGTLETRAERVLFPATISPLLHRCDLSVSLGVCDTMEPINQDSFAKAKNLTESFYSCLGVTCEDIGGIWNPATDSFFEGAQSCAPVKIQSPPPPGLTSIEIALIIVATAVIGFAAYSVFKQIVRIRKRLRVLDEENDDDLSIISAGSANSIT